MSIPLPNLDDRKFQDLVDEAIRLIPQFNRDWTNYNMSDPGITIIELFAWLIEGTLYQMNYIPLENKIKFLSLLGVSDESLADLDPEKVKARLNIRLEGDLDNTLDDVLNEILEEKIKEVYDLRYKLRAITDQDFSDIVEEVLSEYGLECKTYIINNINFRDFALDPDVAYDNADKSRNRERKYNKTWANNGEGYNTVVVIPWRRIIPLPQIEEKKAVYSLNQYNEKLRNAMGVLDPYFESATTVNYFEKNVKKEIIRAEKTVIKDFDFGYSMSMYKDRLLIGAPGERYGKNGKAFIYRVVDGKVQRDENKMLDITELEDYGTDSGFGKSVLITKDYAVVGVCTGSSNDGKKTGELYIFEELEGKWKAVDPSPVISETNPAYLFGSVLAGTEEFIFVGSPKQQVIPEDSSPGVNSGKVFITYKEGGETWKRYGELICPGQNTGSDTDDVLTGDDQFGKSISAIEEGYLAVSVPGKKKVIIYKYDPDSDQSNKWVVLKDIFPPDLQKTRHFGTAVVLHSDWLFVSGKGKVIENEGLSDEKEVEKYLVYVYAQNKTDDGLSWESTPCAVLTHETKYSYSYTFGEKMLFDGSNLAVYVKSWESSRNIKSRVDIFRFNKVKKWYNEGHLSALSSYKEGLGGFTLYDDTLVMGFPFEDPEGYGYIMKLPIQLVIDDFDPSPELIEVVSRRLDERRIISNRIFVRGPVFRRFQAVLELVLEKGVDKEDVEARVKNSILKYFDPVKGGEDGSGYAMGRPVYKSEIIELIEETEGVDYLYDMKVVDESSGDHLDLKDMDKPEYYEILILEDEIIFEYVTK